MNSDVGITKADGENIPMDPILATPTNVTRIARSVAKYDWAGNTQISFYQSGIGTYDILDKWVGGVSGLGLSEHIREAYQFIAANFDQQAGDEIFLVGFSRGSFTARSIASFINDVGLITPQGMQFFYPIFEDWENQLKPNYETHFPNLPFPGPRPSLCNEQGQAAYRSRLQALGFTIPNVRIKAVACYDTVGALGIPRMGIFQPGKPPHHSIDYAFVDTSVPKAVQHAIHALALDERREPFSPTLWELPNPAWGQTLTQVWFQGGHSDVGGSYDDTRAADITLAWMAQRLSELGLAFDLAVLKSQFGGATEEKREPRPWACGDIHDAMSLTYFLGGIAHRMPDQYLRYNHSTGEPWVPAQPLVNTCERVHSSVRVRMGLPGPGIGNKRVYTSRALEGWDLKGTVKGELGHDNVKLETIREGQKSIYWEKESKRIPEDLLGPLEYELLRTFLPTCERKFLSITPPSR